LFVKIPKAFLECQNIVPFHMIISPQQHNFRQYPTYFGTLSYQVLIVNANNFDAFYGHVANSNNIQQ
jgi:hypothetical protein